MNIKINKTCYLDIFCYSAFHRNELQIKTTWREALLCQQCNNGVLKPNPIPHQQIIVNGQSVDSKDMLTSHLI